MILVIDFRIEILAVGLNAAPTFGIPRVPSTVTLSFISLPHELLIEFLQNLHMPGEIVFLL